MHTEVARFEPDVVLLDSADAAGYGESWNKATWLHARDRPIAVSMFTAHTRELAETKRGISERSKGTAFVGFVPKPFDLQELIDVVGRACHAAERQKFTKTWAPCNTAAYHSTVAITAAMIRTMATARTPRQKHVDCQPPTWL
jgi:DNA-binding NtrC family response regulator